MLKYELKICLGIESQHNINVKFVISSCIQVVGMIKCMQYAIRIGLYDTLIV